MTRKHYQAIADVISRISNPAIRQAVAEDMADAIGPFNPAFNRSRFTAACNETKVSA
jgi:hypothetical protein